MLVLLCGMRLQMEAKVMVVTEYQGDNHAGTQEK